MERTPHTQPKDEFYKDTAYSPPAGPFERLKQSLLDDAMRVDDVVVVTRSMEEFSAWARRYAAARGYEIPVNVTINQLEGFDVVERSWCRMLFQAVPRSMVDRQDSTG